MTQRARRTYSSGNTAKTALVATEGKPPPAGLAKPIITRFDGGAPALGEIENSLGFADRMAACVANPWAAGRSAHILRLWMLPSGSPWDACWMVPHSAPSVVIRSE